MPRVDSDKLFTRNELQKLKPVQKRVWQSSQLSNAEVHKTRDAAIERKRDEE